MMTEHKQSFVVPRQYSGERIDKWLCICMPEMTRSALQRLCEDGFVLQGNSPVSKNYKLREGDVLTVSIPEPKRLDVVAQNIPLQIVYEDDDLLVVNKPKGMVVHPAAGNYEGTLVNALLYHCRGRLSSINGVIRPGIVHRIDKNTSGLLIVAKNDFSHQALAQQIKEHSFTRIYEAVVYGSFQTGFGTIDAPIGRHSTDRKKMAVTQHHAKPAVTHYEVICQYRKFCHVRCRLETGRTHQIRVHMAYIGHPIAGDEIYGPKKKIEFLHGQCLHARTIGFIHPIKGNYLEFTSELPPYFSSFLECLGKEVDLM